MRSDHPLLVTLDVSAVPAQPVGAGRYTIELASALADLGALALHALARRDDEERWRRVLGEGSGSDVSALAPVHRPARLVWEQTRLPGFLRHLHPDVHHGPHYTMPERVTIPRVVTIHDVTFIDHPEWHQRSKVPVFRRAIKEAARRADVIVCVSETTAIRLREVVDVRPPVVVAPHGVDHRRFFALDGPDDHDEAALRSLGLDTARPFILYVGTIEPRKGVADLVRAFAEIARTHHDLDLVLAGRQGWGPDEVGTLLGVSSLAERVHRTGYVPDNAVPALLRRARVVAYPAAEEGYGLPALEALACGAPLVTTRGTAMDEVAGGAARLVDAGDVEGLIGAIDAIVSGSDGEVAQRRALGLERARERTWQASAQRHLHAYRVAAGREDPAPEDLFPRSE